VRVHNNVEPFEPRSSQQLRQSWHMGATTPPRAVGLDLEAKDLDVDGDEEVHWKEESEG
jgi:hypothetical protein